jgi:hypothetical protein
LDFVVTKLISWVLCILVFVGFAQGVQRSVTGVATILGPLWGGSLGHRLVIMLSVMAGLEAFLGVSMLETYVPIYALMWYMWYMYVSKRYQFYLSRELGSTPLSSRSRKLKLQLKTSRPKITSAFVSDSKLLLRIYAYIYQFHLSNHPLFLQFVGTHVLVFSSSTTSL